MDRLFSWEKFDQIPVVGILRNFPQQKMEMLAQHYAAAGLTTLEITMNSRQAAETIASLVEAFGHQLNIGAGTVCTLKDLDTALSAGAQFIVTPIVNEEVIKRCAREKIPIFAGAYTPTEIYRAWATGASMVKVFPAGRLGPQYIKEVLAPLDQIKLMPTGGVTADNFTEFLKAGAKGLGMGGGLFPKLLIENEQWDEFHSHLLKFVRKYQGFSNS